MPKKTKKSKQAPNYKAGTWEPSLVEKFLKFHEFGFVNMDGDDALWRGKKPDSTDAQVAFPVRRRQLTPGTMRDSVMRQSGYSKKHWDLWRSLSKGERRKKMCCTKKYI